MTIVLPERIYIMRSVRNCAVIGGIGGEQYNIYFKNIILPYKDEYDIKVICDYGENYGEFWRIEEFPYDINEFTLEIVVYDACGDCLDRKKTVVVMSEKKERPEYCVMAIGDSMTHAGIYPAHVMHKLNKINFKGTRSFDGHLYIEGRGGWLYKSYFSNKTVCWGGVSPFLFPKDIDGEYYGDIDFENAKLDTQKPLYSYDGFGYSKLQPGQVFHEKGKLYKMQSGQKILVSENPAWEFSFKKYMKKHNIGRLDAVALFMGGNDLQIVEYEKSAETIREFVENTEKVVRSIKEYDDTIKIIIMLPVIGAEQFAWGKRMKCICTSKQYRYNVIRAAEKLINTFHESDEIYIASTLQNIDPVFGFDAQPYKANIYSDAYVMRHSNWVHPNRIGYMQIGDSLAAIIEYLRENKQIYKKHIAK